MASGENTNMGNEVSGSRDNRKPLVVSIEGNIGSGKSSFLSFCSTIDKYDVYQEPIDKWQNVKGENLMANFYENPSRWAMSFQLYVSMSIFDIYQYLSWKPIKMIERSLLSSQYCFVELLKRYGNIPPLEGFILDTWFERALRDNRAKPNAIVYIHTSPSVAYERLQTRARPEEATVTLGYLEDLHNLYEQWIAREYNTHNIPIHIINGNQPMQEIHEQYEKCLNFLNLLASE